MFCVVSVLVVGLSIVDNGLCVVCMSLRWPVVLGRF